MGLSDMGVKAACVDAADVNLKGDGSNYRLTWANAEKKDDGTWSDINVYCNAASWVYYHPNRAWAYVECEDPRAFCEAKFPDVGKCPGMCNDMGRCQAEDYTGAGSAANHLAKKFLGFGGSYRISMAQSLNEPRDYRCWCYGGLEGETQEHLGAIG